MSNTKNHSTITRPDKKEKLQTAIEYLYNLIDAIQEIIDGSSETNACKNHNIDKSAFRRLIFDEKLGYKYDKPINITDITMSPAEKLYCAVFDINPETHRDEIPYDIEETFEFVLNSETTITDREKEMLRRRYYEDLSYEEIGRLFSITRERVRHIIVRTLRKLRAYDRVHHNLIKYGKIQVDNALSELKKIQTKNTISNEVQNFKTQCEKAIAENNKNAVYKCYQDCRALLESNGDTRTNPAINIGKQLSINILELSMRPFNCLNRYDITTIYDFSQITPNKMCHMRNMGIHSCREIYEKLSNLGLLNEQIKRQLRKASVYQIEGNEPIVDLKDANTIARILDISEQISQ